MRRFFFLLLLFALFTTATAQDELAPEPIPGEAVYIPFPVAIMLDGDLADWASVPQITVDDGPMISLNPAENGAFTFAVAADSTNLYVLMTMIDQNIITGQHGTNYWNEDSLEFYINLSDERFATSYGEGIYQININPGDIGNSDPANITLTGTNSTNSGLQAAVFATDEGWGFEAAFPLDGRLTPEHGTEIGFQAHANGATTSNRDVKLIWSAADPNDNSWQDPSLFGAGIFYEIGRDDVPQPSQRPDPVKVVEETQVSVNQVGYFVDGPKLAMLAGGGNSRTIWMLLDAETGDSISAGRTTPGVADPASGDTVQIADFSDFEQPGRYRLMINNVRSPVFEIATHPYPGLMTDALRYFYHNRSGTPIEAEYVGEDYARRAGHTSDNDVTCYAGTDGDGVTWGGCAYRLDAGRGWYDAGDHGKYVVNGGISAWTLMNLYEQNPAMFADGDLNIPESDDGVPDILNEIRWQMDFMLGMQIPEDQPQAGMVHHKLHELDWSPMPHLPPTEVDNDNPAEGRYLMPPTTAATLNLAATAAQCSRVWRDHDTDYAEQCLQAAQSAWVAANENPVQLAGNTPGVGGGNYDDVNVLDEFFWAAAELYITTGADEYRDYLLASRYFENFDGLDESKPSAMYWGDTGALGTISLALLPNGLDNAQIEVLRGQIIAAADRYLNTLAQEGYRVPIDQNGYVWGSNSVVMNNAIILAYAHRFTENERYLHGVIHAMDYALGRNTLARSFVSGYGETTLENPHHRFWANEPTNGFPPPPPGVLAGGPNTEPNDPTALAESDLEGGPARRYVDLRGSWSTNEVTINWNAPLAWVTGYLNQQFAEE
jgi:endoglucanase